MRIKLRRLPEWNLKRRTNARRYDELFNTVVDAIAVPYEPPYAQSVYHLYVIKVQSRDQLQADLARAGIATQIHYPTPLHLQRAYAGLGYREGDFPIAEMVTSQILSLPMYPQLELPQQARVVERVVDSCSASACGAGAEGSRLRQ